ncbi:uncharacterized protein LOC129289372 [Prosopis cineraria]|uniref:uncharacterized protein LOC129289372 n=1 Tax=Prosopis cineraria TaxID=364024 RepID=UPI00240EC6B4|nr:uncharacterized protein LOC129289372 [Prosopis cineraria]
MASQPPSRPWFRLTSLRSVAAPPQDPRPPLVQTTNSTSSPPPQSASSPVKGETMARVSSPSEKQVVRTVMQSPKAKPTPPPPSPLTLPPAQLKANSEAEPNIPEEAEPKNVILQKTIEKPKQWQNGNSATQKNHNEKQNGNHRKSWGSEDSRMKIITIAGENRGAYIELIQSPKKHEFGDKPNHLYKSENAESGGSSSDEGNVKKKENKSNRRTKSSHPMAAFMNSNVQCMNNSLLYNASCSHHDPGLRVSLTRKPLESGGFHLKKVGNDRHD